MKGVSMKDHAGVVRLVLDFFHFFCVNIRPPQHTKYSNINSSFVLLEVPLGMVNLIQNLGIVKIFVGMEDTKGTDDISKAAVSQYVTTCCVSRFISDPYIATLT